MEERRNPTFNSRYSNNSRNKFLSNEGPSNSSNKYRRQRTKPPNLPQKPNPNLDLGRQRTTPNLPQKPTNPNLDLDLVKRIEFLINQDPRDLIRKLDELRDQLSRSCEISERPNRERERQIPVSRRTLSSSSFRRQNPGNEFPDYQNPGNHFPVSNSYRPNPSREHEKYRRVRLLPRDNYSQYNSIKTRENYNYNNNYNHYGVEENYGFAPVERHLLGSQEYERRSLNGSVYSADWASQRSESSKRRAKRSFLPLNGASPFAICDACFSLLQIPSGFVFNKGKKMLNFKCGNCSEVINIKISDHKIDSSFSTGSSQNWNYDSLRERRRVYSKDVNPVSLSTEMEEREYDYGYDKSDKSSGFLEASGSFSHEREVLEHLFNTQEKRKSLVLSEEIEEKREELERSSEDIKEAVEIEPLMNRFISDKNIHEEKVEEFNAIIDGTDLGNDKEEMEISSSVSERNLNDAALNEDINAFHVEGAENKEEMEASSLDEFKREINGENVEKSSLDEFKNEINGENVEKSSLDEFKGEINRENVEIKEQMEISVPESEPLVNGSVFEDNSESVERPIKDEIENSESIERPIKNENSEEMERFMKDEMEKFITDEMERFINDENSEQIQRYIKNENSEQIERSIKDENSERIERLVTDKSSEEMERSFKDEISEEMERSIRVDSVNSEETGRSIRAGSVNSEEERQKSIRVDSVNSEEMERSIREIDRSLRVDSVNSEEMERSIRVDSVNSSSNRGSSRSSLDEDQQGTVIGKNGDSSFLGGLIKKSFKDFSLFNSSSEGSKCKVFVNGHPISERAVKRAEKKAGPIDPGNYWYDYHAGFWGVMGHECLGIIPPFIREFNYPMVRDCAGGRTGVVVNGRELHRKDLEVLVRRGLPATSARAYAIEMSGKVVDVASGRELKNLGKLAPTIEILKHGFGMLVPQDLS